MVVGEANGGNGSQSGQVAIQELPIGSGGSPAGHTSFIGVLLVVSPVQNPLVRIDVIPAILRPECQAYRLIEIDIRDVP